MAGFHDQGSGPFDLRAVPHPAVTLVLEFGDGPFAVAAAGGSGEVSSPGSHPRFG